MFQPPHHPTAEPSDESVERFTSGKVRQTSKPPAFPWRLLALLVATTMLTLAAAAVTMAMLLPSDVLVEVDGHLVGGTADTVIAWAITVASVACWTYCSVRFRRELKLWPEEKH